MKFTVKSMPKVLDEPGPSGDALRRELGVARDQIGSLYRGEVIKSINTTKPHPPVDMGTMVGGISTVNLSPLSVRVTTSPMSRPYDLVMELGRRPQQPGPPMAPILAWVQRKLGLTGAAAKSAAFAIRRKIHEKGTKPRHFFKRARASRSALSMARKLAQAAVARWKKVVA